MHLAEEEEAECDTLNAALGNLALLVSRLCGSQAGLGGKYK
jgi:hypothetical protein